MSGGLPTQLLTRDVFVNMWGVSSARFSRGRGGREDIAKPSHSQASNSMFVRPLQLQPGGNPAPQGFPYRAFTPHTIAPIGVMLKMTTWRNRQMAPSHEVGIKRVPMRRGYSHLHCWEAHRKEQQMKRKKYEKMGVARGGRHITNGNKKK